MRTVVVVEDTGACATTLEIALERIKGLRVQVATTAEEARRLVESEPSVCAIVTDVHLPQASGLDLIGWIRSRDRGMPIVVISGDSDPETPSRTLAAGADAFFAKPFSPSLVRQKLEDLIHAESSAPPMR
jgi:DNA-binding NtrC family response regulator